MPEPIPQAVLFQKIAPLLDRYAKPYRKTGLVKARVAILEERIETHTADGLETTNVADPGDYIVTNTTRAGESYVLPPESFQEKYEPVGDGLYRPTGFIQAVELTQELLRALELPDEFYFTAPWNDPMIAKTGDFLACSTDKGEVYRIARREFFETYQAV